MIDRPYTYMLISLNMIPPHLICRTSLHFGVFKLDTIDLTVFLLMGVSILSVSTPTVDAGNEETESLFGLGTQDAKC